MATPFERGLKAGRWTRTQMRECGFNSSDEVLRHEEEVYEEDMAGIEAIRASNPELAEQQSEYLNGKIHAARRSLRR